MDNSKVYKEKWGFWFIKVLADDWECSIRKIVDKQNSCLFMKLNKSKIAYIIRKMNQGMSGRQIAIDLKLSYERVYQIYREYIKTDKIPELKQAGRPKEPLSETEINLILNSYSKYYVSASLLSPIIEKK